MQDRRDEFSFTPSADRIAFRDALRARLAAVNMTAAELARRAGLSKDAISAYTKMRSLPTPASLAKVARALDCKPADLLGTPTDVKRVETFFTVRPCDHPGFVHLTGRGVFTMRQCAEILRLIDCRPA